MGGAPRTHFDACMCIDDYDCVQASFLWTACRLPSAGQPACLRVRLEAGVRVVPLERCVPEFVSHHADPFGIGFLVAPGQVVVVDNDGVVVRPGAGGAGFLHEESAFGERIARRTRNKSAYCRSTD